MLCEHLEILILIVLYLNVNFDVEEIIECCELWIEWYVLMWIIKCIYLCNIFEIRYGWLYDGILSMKSHYFNINPLVSLLIGTTSSHMTCVCTCVRACVLC